MYVTLSFSEFSSQAYVTNHWSEVTSSDLQPTYQTRLSVSLYVCLFGRGRGECGKSLPHIDHRTKILWKQGNFPWKVGQQLEHTHTHTHRHTQTHTHRHTQTHTHRCIQTEICWVRSDIICTTHTLMASLFPHKCAHNHNQTWPNTSHVHTKYYKVDDTQLISV